MAHCTQLCTTKKNFYSQQIKKFLLGITLFDTFSLLFQKEKNLMPLFLIACNRGLKDLSKNVLEQFLMSGGITNNKSSLADRVFVELLFFFTNSDKYMRAVWSTKALKVKIRIL